MTQMRDMNFRSWQHQLQKDSYIKFLM